MCLTVFHFFYILCTFRFILFYFVSSLIFWKYTNHTYTDTHLYISSSKNGLNHRCSWNHFCFKSNIVKGSYEMQKMFCFSRFGAFSKNVYLWGCAMFPQLLLMQSTQFFEWYFKSTRHVFDEAFFLLSNHYYDEASSLNSALKQT